MQLDERCAGVRGGRDLLAIGVDEQADRATFRRELGRHALHALQLGAHVEPALGRHFLARLGHEAERLGAAAQRERDHLGIERALEVEQRADRAPQVGDVGVLDVAAILAQMARDALRTRAFGALRPLDRIGKGLAASLTQGGDVVDVDVQARHGGGRGLYGP